MSEYLVIYRGAFNIELTYAMRVRAQSYRAAADHPDLVGRAHPDEPRIVIPNELAIYGFQHGVYVVESRYAPVVGLGFDFWPHVGRGKPETRWSTEESPGA
jgi:hypothetical protein